jgi:glycosyltransferase involved in cell wall biosynthesis
MLRIIQYGVHDAAYPRNARVRAALRARFGAEVVVLPRSRAASRLRRLRDDVGGLWRASRGADVVMLAEMRVTHAPLVWAVGRLRRAIVVVDGFIGLHETAVEDWGVVRPRSLRARRFAAQDLLAARAGDLVVTDTAVRASALGVRSGRAVLDLPVGAPDWARPTASPRGAGPLRVLYYGNYIPLHGVDLVVDALAQLAERRDFAATFVGDGIRRTGIERRVAELGLEARITFTGPVPESSLGSLIARHDVVLGVFGSSPKARSVVANKVWQGLACGRTVVTQQSAAVAELGVVAGSLLVPTTPGDAASLAGALARLRVDELRSEAHRAAHEDVADRLEAFVAQRFDRFARRLATLVARRLR